MDIYAEYFHDRVNGVTGTPEQVAAVKSMNAVYGFTLDGAPIYPPFPEHYEVYHASYIYFYAPQGELVDIFTYAMHGVDIARRVKAILVAEGGTS